MVPVLFRTNYIDRLIQLLQRAKREIVHYHYLPLTIIMVQEDVNVGELFKLDVCQDVPKCLSLLMTHTLTKYKYSRVFGKAVLKEMCEVPVLVSTQAIGLRSTP